MEKGNICLCRPPYCHCNRPDKSVFNWWKETLENNGDVMFISTTPLTGKELTNTNK